MKTKLTLEIDEELISKFNSIAQAHGLTISELVENWLGEITKTRKLSFSEKWRGQFEIIRKQEPRFKKLHERYIK
jgi:antitoxin component of RelBE/YafQ-DinJ toxin-antitoxin module